MEPTTATTNKPKTEKRAEADVVLSLENLIKNHVQSIETLTEEKKQKSQMVKDAYESDAEYHELDEKAKDGRKAASEVKKRILEREGNRELAVNLTETKLELKEKRQGLSDYLLEYKRISGFEQLELFDGQIGEIVLSASLVKKQN